MKRLIAIGLCTVSLLLSLQGCAAAPQADRPSWGRLDRQTVEWYRSTHTADNSSACVSACCTPSGFDASRQLLKNSEIRTERLFPFTIL